MEPFVPGEILRVGVDTENVPGGILRFGDGRADDHGGHEHIVGEDGVVEQRGVLERRRRRHRVRVLLGPCDLLGGEADGEAVERL